MDFSYNEEQTLFSDSLAKLLSGASAPRSGRALSGEDEDHDAALWQACADLGLLGLTFPEQYGGFEGGAIDAMVAAIEFGKHLSVAPFISSVVLGGGAVRLAGSDAQKVDILPRIVAGELTVATAFTEPDSRFDLADVATRAVNDGSGFRLSGTKAVVFGGASADLLVVSARTAGDNRHSQQGLSLFLVDANADGVEKIGYRMVDGRMGADITFDEVFIASSHMLGLKDQAYATIEHIADLGTAAMCAEALGAMEKINDLTLEYLKVRQQFGRPIGKFQVLQHHMADMLIEYEHAKSLVYEACMLADSPNATERGKAVSAAKVFLGEKGRALCQKAMQMHGGIGITEEYELGGYVKRVTAAEFAFGDVDHHLIRYADLSNA